jgi:hypothetical protein
MTVAAGCNDYVVSLTSLLHMFVCVHGCDVTSNRMSNGTLRIEESFASSNSDLFKVAGGLTQACCLLSCQEEELAPY